MIQAALLIFCLTQCWSGDVLVTVGHPSSRQSPAQRARPTPEDNPILGVTKTGTPITEQLADQLAAEAEAGYDLGIARRVGRRSLAGGAGASPRVNFRMPSELYEHARARAERDGKTVSEVARDALAAYLERCDDRS